MWIALRTLAVGAAGAAAAYWLAVPAPFLTGPAFCVTLSALLGLRASLPNWYRDAFFVLIGVNMGTSVTPEALATAARWPGSLLVLSLSILAILLGGARLLAATSGLGRMSSLLAATPGHLSFVLSLSSELRADIGKVTMIQTMRVLALTLIVPFIAPLLSDAPLPLLRPIGEIMTGPALALTLVLSAALGVVFRRLRVPAALLLGGMAVSSLAHALSITEGTVPRWLSMPAFISMGTLIGTRFTGITIGMVLQSLRATTILTAFAALVSVAGSVFTARLLDIPILTVLIAFAPGGLETMMAMSVLLHANPAYVAAHHVFRLLFLTFALPTAVALYRRRA